MVVELRRLIFQADVDGTGFKSGSDQVVSGAKAMESAMQGVVVAATDIENKISRAGDGVTRLSRLYVTGYGDAERFNNALRTLGRALDTNNVSGEQAGQILDGLYRRYNMVADAAGIAQKGQTALAKAVEQANTRFEAQQKLTPANTTNRFLSTNIASQFQDIAVTSAMGMNPATIALQQGSQLAGAFQMGGVNSISGGAKALASGFAELLSPISLVTVALTGVTAAAIGYFSRSSEEAKTTSDILKQHEESIKALGAAYGGAAKNLEAFTSISRSLVDLQSRASTTQLSAQLRTSQNGFLDQFGVQRNQRTVGGETFFASSDYKPFEETLRQLQHDIKDGKDGMDAFYASVKSIADANPSVQSFADKIVGAVGDIDQLTRAMKAAKIAQDALFNDRGPNGMLLSQGTTNQADKNAASIYQSQQAVTLQRMRQQYDASIAAMNATTPEEKAAAARQAAAAQYNDSESPEQRKLRIELAGTQALTQAEHELSEAQRMRRLDLEKTVQDAQFEITTIGKTGGQIAALRKEYELTSQLRLEAAKNGTTVDQAEIDLIKQKAAELGKLTDAYNKRNLQQNISDSYTSLYRSPEENQIAAQLKQYGQPDNLQSQEAGQIRDLLRAQQFKADVQSFVTTFGQELAKNGGNIGKSLGTSIESALLNQANRLWDKLGDMLGTILTKALMGGDSGSANGLGGLLGKALTGGAANDNGVTGGLLKGYQKGDVTSASLASATDSMSIYQQAIKSIESGGNYSALGPITASGDRAYGAYQVMGANIPSWTKSALGYSMTPSQFLGSQSAQDAVFNNQFGGYVSKYGASNAAQAWFGGPGSVGSGGNAADMLGTTGSQYVAKFNDAVSKATGSVGSLGNGLNAAATGLGSLGNGLNSFSGQISNILKNGGAGTGGSLFDNLLGGFGKLVGGISPTSSLWRANTTLGSFLLNGYADGTDYAPGGMAIVGERGPELVNLPRGSQVVPNHRTATANTGKSSSGGTDQSRVVHVHIDGANGDDHVRALVQQGVQQGLSTYNESQRRGGVGALQARYSNQKG